MTVAPEPPCGRHPCRVVGWCCFPDRCSFEDGSPVTSHTRKLWMAARDGAADEAGWDYNRGVYGRKGSRPRSADRPNMSQGKRPAAPKSAAKRRNEA